MRNRRSFFALLVATIVFTGCSTERPYPALTLPSTVRLVEVPDCSSYAPGTGSEPHIQQVALKPHNVLVLSGGGVNGAYTAGVLKGWTVSGTRPQFEVVTGISAGALIATFAFLGPQYDDVLTNSVLEMRDRDVYDRRFLPALLWSDSLADSAPLRARIAAQVTPELLAKVAQAHAEGRRLYVGTTDLDSKRLVVWDMGAIAAGSEPDKLELFREVLLASASVPGVLPPVPINVLVSGRRYTELHVDGGVSASLFLQPTMLGMNPDCEADRIASNSNVYVIMASKLRPTPRPVKRWFFHVAEESIDGVLQSRSEGDLLKVYLLSRSAGAQFRLTAVPDDFNDDADMMSFDPKVMKDLFDRGYRCGVDGKCWLGQPAGLTCREHQPPRSGVNFNAEPVRAPQAGVQLECAHPLR